MATPTLPSATSIVDFLNSQKQDSSFSARKKLYTTAGLDKTLGEFVGSASQNLNLLKSLQKTSTPATETVKTIGGSVPVATPAKVETPPAPASVMAPKMSIAQSTPATINPASTILSNAGVPGFTPAPTPAPVSTPVAPSAPAPATPSSAGYQGNSIVDFLNLNKQPSDFTSRQKLAASLGISDYRGSAEQNTALLGALRGGASQSIQTDQNVKQETGISASSIYPDIFTEGNDRNEADLVNEWLTSPEGQLFLDKQAQKGADEAATAAAAKQALEAKYATDKTTLEQNLADKGLAFSGIRASQVAALATSLASSLLKEDRDTASKLLNADLDLREAVLKGVADLAKSAQDGRKEAIQQLNAIGYAVIDGKLVPTLSARAAERADAAAVRADEAAARSERRLELAEAAAARAGSGSSGNKLTYAEALSRNLPLTLVGKTETDVIDSFYSTTPPDWFVEKVNRDAQQTLLPDAVQKLWDKSSQEYLTGAKDSASHAKAVSYFKGAYGDAVTEDQIKQLADEVDLQINAGLSYKDAINKVIEDNTE